jgi:hypothetical protein
MWRFPLVVLSVLVVGCSQDPRDVVDYSNEPIGMQLQRAEPMLKQRRFNTLLDFESADDLVFISANPPATQSLHRAHTGKASASIGTNASIKLASVMAGRPFPGDWTVAGAYVYAEHPANITLDCLAGDKAVHRQMDVPANRWTPAFVDLTQMTRAKASADPAFTITSTEPLWCDDVMVIDNTNWYVSGDQSPWTIKQRGFKLTIEREQWFSIALDTLDASSEGWKLEDASNMRAVLSSPGKTKWLTIYSDGRAFWDGRFEPLSGPAKQEPLLARGHESPGKIDVAEGMGRINRNTDGDANNDGYNERLGAYQLIASGPRMEMTMSAHGAPIVRPILEIANLPAGKPVVTLEGRLVESLIRLKNGNVLVEIPARIEQPATINVHVE